VRPSPSCAPLSRCILQCVQWSCSCCPFRKLQANSASRRLITNHWPLRRQALAQPAQRPGLSCARQIDPGHSHHAYVSGEGKTVTSIGLAQGLERIGRKAIVTSREPSLGPVFGLKAERPAAACRSGTSQKSTFTFTATSTPSPPRITCWPPWWMRTSSRQRARSRSRSDRVAALAGYERPRPAPHCRLPGLERWRLEKGGRNRQTGFVITAASEIMAILGLRRAAPIFAAVSMPSSSAVNRSGHPVTAADLGATGAMMALLTRPFCLIWSRPLKARPPWSIPSLCQHRARHQLGSIATDGNPPRRLRSQ